MRPVTVSRHFFRRTARASERALEARFPQRDFKVVSSFRGPVGWRVVRTR